MHTHKALDFFGKGQKPHKQRGALASAAGVTRQTVSRWVQMKCVPFKHATQLAALSRGKCPVDLSAYITKEEAKT